MGYVSLIDGYTKNAEHCVCCGQVIPEGNQYCIVCGYKVKQEPKVDFVNVARCKECKHYVANYCTRDIKGRTNMFYMNDTDFCSYGERKEK